MIEQDMMVLLEIGIISLTCIYIGIGRPREQSMQGHIFIHELFGFHCVTGGFEEFLFSNWWGRDNVEFSCLFYILTSRLHFMQEFMCIFLLNIGHLKLILDKVLVTFIHQNWYSLMNQTKNEWNKKLSKKLLTDLP